MDIMMKRIIVVLCVCLIMISFSGNHVAMDGQDISYQGNPREHVSRCFIYGHGVRYGCGVLRRFIQSDRFGVWGPGGLNSYTQTNDNSPNFEDLTGYVVEKKEQSPRSLQDLSLNTILKYTFSRFIKQDSQSNIFQMLGMEGGQEYLFREAVKQINGYEYSKNTSIESGKIYKRSSQSSSDVEEIDPKDFEYGSEIMFIMDGKPESFRNSNTPDIEELNRFYEVYKSNRNLSHEFDKFNIARIWISGDVAKKYISKLKDRKQQLLENIISIQKGFIYCLLYVLGCGYIDDIFSQDIEEMAGIDRKLSRIEAEFKPNVVTEPEELSITRL